MGDDAVIVQGTHARDKHLADLQRTALFSTVHGAGRVMSRSAAAGKVNRRTGKVLKPGAVSPRMMEDWVKQKGVVLRGGGLDESPHVYRRLPEVLAAQKGTIEVLHTLRPLIVVMAGADLSIRTRTEWDALASGQRRDSVDGALGVDRQQMLFSRAMPVVAATSSAPRARSIGALARVVGPFLLGGAIALVPVA